MSDVRDIEFLVLRAIGASSLKKTFSFTLNANIFQSVRSNIMKFSLHDPRKFWYKIIRLDSKKLLFSDSLDECNRNSSFEWFLPEKWPWDFRG